MLCSFCFGMFVLLCFGLGFVVLFTVCLLVWFWELLLIVCVWLVSDCGLLICLIVGCYCRIIILIVLL